MNQYEQLKAISTYVNELFHDDVTGHDFFHMKRVANISSTIAQEEGADPFICKAAGLLHDIGDRKLFAHPENALKNMEMFLGTIDITNREINQIKLANKDISYSKGEIPVTNEGKIVQDADRLDALGAIGIARTFAYGGAKGQLIFQDEETGNTSIHHFYDKLLKLRDSMNTVSARKMANERHLFIENYLQQFFKEWQ